MEGPSLAVMFRNQVEEEDRVFQEHQITLPPMFLVQYYCPQISLVSAHSESLFREINLQSSAKVGAGLVPRIAHWEGWGS